ncbi:low temperature requirement protein A [Deinococcus aquaticus]|uniref:Low temperature requirement protein A n=1 Tax=Deinococcus aquaticus TaxID=328692 RepID=A0ABY7V0X9_9DEIO|nr:low temperature requirement protein A [Deinococcus aquaticus]WDA57626.1 low temperature requirement protein A [Deinococcus aquaticus]
MTSGDHEAPLPGGPDAAGAADGTSPISGDGGEDAQGEPTQRVTWLELFYDLIFVVAFDQLALRLGDAHSPENLLVFGLTFTAVWWAWANNTLFAARYGNERRTYRLVTLAQLLTMTLLAMTLRGDLSDTGAWFALAYAVNHLLQAGLYLRASRTVTADQVPSGAGGTGDGSVEGRALFARHMAGLFALAAALWIASAFLPGGGAAQLSVWVVALLVDVLRAPLIRSGHQHAPPHAGHLPERVGLLQIIALGAIVTEIVGGGRQQALTPATLLPAMGGVLTVVALWQLYFSQARTLPLLETRRAGQIRHLLAWLYAHLPFTLSVVTLGVGLGHTLGSADPAEDAAYQKLLTFPLAGAFLSLAFLRLNALRITRRTRRDRSLLALLLGGVLAAALAVPDLDTPRLLLLVTALSVTVAGVVSTDPATRRLNVIEEQSVDTDPEDGPPDPTS